MLIETINFKSSDFLRNLDLENLSSLPAVSPLHKIWVRNLNYMRGSPFLLLSILISMLFLREFIRKLMALYFLSSDIRAHLSSLPDVSPLHKIWVHNINYVRVSPFMLLSLLFSLLFLREFIRKLMALYFLSSDIRANLSSLPAVSPLHKFWVRNINYVRLSPFLLLSMLFSMLFLR